MPGSMPTPLALTEEQRCALERLVGRPTSPQSLALRCRIVLACAEGRSNLGVAADLGIDRKTVTKWRTRFLSLGIDGLHDQPRPGAPRTITDDDVKAVIVRTLARTPDGVGRWSTRSMAHATGISQSTISRIWRSFGLKPHLANRTASSTNAFGDRSLPGRPCRRPELTLMQRKAAPMTAIFLGGLDQP